jgi:hypothetical protein
MICVLNILKRTNQVTRVDPSHFCVVRLDHFVMFLALARDLQGTDAFMDPLQLSTETIRVSPLSPFPLSSLGEIPLIRARPDLLPQSIRDNLSPSEIGQILEFTTQMRRHQRCHAAQNFLDFLEAVLRWVDGSPTRCEACGICRCDDGTTAVNCAQFSKIAGRSKSSTNELFSTHFVSHPMSATRMPQLANKIPALWNTGMRAWVFWEPKEKPVEDVRDRDDTLDFDFDSDRPEENMYDDEGYFDFPL